MLKDKTGSEFKLNHPNPLMESQNLSEDSSESYNLDNIGVDIVGTPNSNEVSDTGNLENIGEETMIRKTDGTPYSLAGDAKNWDIENPDQDLFHSADQEIIEFSGSPVLYYKVIIDENNYDDVYMEARGKTRRQEPIELFANWEPVTPTNDMGVFGIDSPDEVNFHFNIREFREKVGDDLPKVGSLIYTPFDKNWWEIIQYNHGEAGQDFKMWGKYRLNVLARKYQGSQSDIEPSRPEIFQSSRDITIR